MKNLEIITTARLIILDEYDRLIMAIRPLMSKQRPGDFDFFGGKIEAGEDPVLGLAREVYEETGQVFDPNKIQPIYSQLDIDGSKQFLRLYSLYSESFPIAKIMSLPEHIGAVSISQQTALSLTECGPHRSAIQSLNNSRVA